MRITCWKVGPESMFRIPVIPGINTSEEEMNRMISFVEERREKMKEVHLLPYHRIAENKYSRLRMKQGTRRREEPDQVSFMEELKRKI